MTSKLLLSAIAGWALLLGATNSFAAKDKVYTWKDEKGVVHYGERPPKEAQATLIKTRTGHSEPTPSTPSVTPTAPAAPSVTQETSFIDPERCAIARKNLEILNSTARIRMPGDDGNARLLSDEERDAQRNTMLDVIDQTCE